MTDKLRGSKNQLLGLVKEADAAYKAGYFLNAESLYTKAILLEEENSTLYGNRSASRFCLQKYEDALKDAQKAVKIDPKYAQGYFRLGVVQQYLQHYHAALVAFAKGMSLDLKNVKFLQALIDTALKSPLKASLEPVMKQLKEMNLESNPFVVTSVIGQDLLSHNDSPSAIEVLECAITIGTCSLKLKGSVYSALSSALWTLQKYDRAIHYMKEDLKVSQALSDTPGECRAFGNLGAAYFHQNKLEEALENHRKQLLLAQKLKHKQLIANAYSGMGSVYGGLKDHKKALQHHQQAVEVFTASNDILLKCRELGRVAQSQLSLGDEESSLRSQKDRLHLCASLDDNGKEEAQAFSDIAAVYRVMQKPSEEIACLKKAADISQRLEDTASETKVLLLLGYTSRHNGDSSVALSTYERLLEISLQTNNKILESRACANLGIVYHQIGDFEMALKLQAQCLKLAILTEDVASQGRAYGNIGNAYSASGLYEQAIIHHQKELEISCSVGDKESECSTHGNLAVAYQALQVHDKALHHYKSQYDLSKEIGNTANEARALMNLGNFYNTLNQYCQAIEFYKKYLKLVLKFPDKSGEGRALYNLGFACFSLHDFQEAVTCYERSVAVASECQDKVAMARAYCNLGLAKKALGDYDSAFDCQNTFLTLSTELKSTRGTFKAFGNLGDIYTAKKEPQQAVGFYQRQYSLAEQHKDSALLAQACSSLGSALRSVGQLEQAVALHAKETSLYSDILKDVKNEYKAQGRYGATLTALGRYSEAINCYERQMELSKSNKEPLTEAQAWGNLAITYTNLQDFSRAKSAFESQINILENLFTKSARLEKCRAYCSAGDCCEALQLFHEALTYHQMSLTLSNELKNLSLVQRSCKGLSNSLQQLGKMNSAIKYCEQRLTACERIGNPNLLAATFGDLGYLYSFVGKFEDAIFCLNQQMRIAVELNEENLKSDASCGLGNVYLLLKDYKKALTFHKLDLEIAQRNDNRPCQGRAFGNIAATHEALGDYAAAIPSQEQHLFIAKEQNDEEAKLTALHGIGRNTLRLPAKDYSRAVLLLQQAMLLSHGVNENKEMVSTVLDLAVAMWACDDLRTATVHLAKAVEMAESVCADSYAASNVNGDDSSASLVLDNYKTLTKCYSALICALCEGGNHQAALDVAEKSRTFPERLLSNKVDKDVIKHVTVEEMCQYAIDQNSIVIYYTISAGFLFQWFLSPNGEMTYVGCTSLLDSSDENNNDHQFLSEILRRLQDTLGVVSTDDDSDAGSLIQDQQDQNSPNRKSSLYHRILECQTYYYYKREHISTGNGCLVPATKYGHDTAKFKEKLPFYALYELLISKSDKLLKECTKQTFLPKLVLIADGNLLLVPFCMLKKRPTDHFLGQNFVLNISPSFRHLTEQTFPRDVSQLNYGRCLAFGNPEISPALPDSPWYQSQAAEEEAKLVGQIFRVESFTGTQVNKQTVLSRLGSTEIVHFACHVSWKHPVGVVVGCPDDEAVPIHSKEDDFQLSDDSSSCLNKNQYFDHFSRNVMSSTDIAPFNLSVTKLVVLGSPFLCSNDGKVANISLLSSSISCFVKSLLKVGVKSVLFSMWPVPETASKLLLQTFYTHLLNGRSSTAALAVAMETLRSSQQFEHPSYWAGFSLVGHDFQLDTVDLSINHALCEVVQEDASLSREVLKLVVHLVEKSAQKQALYEASDVPMYTSQDSVSERLNNARGWKALFIAAGFELRPSTNGLPDAIFFPKPGSSVSSQTIVKQLNSFLGLDDEVLNSLGKLVFSPHIAKSLGAWIEESVIKNIALEEEDCFKAAKRKQFVIDRKVWQTDGSNLLLESFGLLVSHLTDETVTLYNISTLELYKVSRIVECLHTLFGRIQTSDSLPCSSLQNYSKQQAQVDVPTNLNTMTNNEIGKNVALPLGMISSKFLEPNIDFNSSYRSTLSEGSSNHLEVSESGIRDDFGVLPLDEPKNFTQVPKTVGLIVPKPILQKSTHTRPLSGTSSSKSSFSPTKKFQFASSLGNMLESKSPSLTRSSDGSPKSSAWSPLTVSSPILSPKTHSKSAPATDTTFNRGSLVPETKVCVVNPRRESPQTKSPSRTKVPSDKFMSLFESMLTKDGSDSSRKSSLSRSFETDDKKSPSLTSAKGLSELDLKKVPEEHQFRTSSTSSNYKPSPSFASSLGTTSPQYEYTLIADKLTHRNIPKASKVDVSVNKKEGTIRSNTSSTHTAFCLINPNQGEPFSKPKLQKYKVETQISTISTLLSENIDLPTTALQSSSLSSASHESGDASKSSSKPSASNTSNIFHHLNSLSLDSSDERVQFV